MRKKIFHTKQKYQMKKETQMYQKKEKRKREKKREREREGQSGRGGQRGKPLALMHKMDAEVVPTNKPFEYLYEIILVHYGLK